jgi:murein DD-endopeptidase MepM/ murein hydrolase activator NlpD
MPRILANGQYNDDAHHGVDLGFYTRDNKLFTGTDVHSVMDGKIAGLVLDRPPYGNAILMETPYNLLPANIILQFGIPANSSIYTLYGHLQNMQNLTIGADVKCGELLAQTGLTGFTGGPHLHLEMRYGEKDTEFHSLGYYRADLTAEEMDNYRLWRMSGAFTLFDPIELLK